ncbi:cysteine--tRNA ligase [Campylobacter sp. RM16192]|uniref:cysteine--tRNA ligase n=1 Tax=Campylobacter sp. RM16192 TaxID=1660080 RepID=UPI0014516ABE|nr:cysteine--tRNA ligase [Campylobacter sp. RM16192]QCD52589.1 cysteinyl-tRNA synthetase [Campylobacter sp. RM16192]
MQIFDSVKKQKLNFEPIESGKVRIYVCGPTVYDDSHLGHAKSAISFDLLRRILIELKFDVKFVKNFTDIDDKILKKMDETGEGLESITNRYIKSYKDDMRALNVLEADIEPKATECLDAIIEYILNLKNKNVAYEIEGDGIYFDTAQDNEYLSLSGKAKSDQNIARVESNIDKRNEEDFVLWKFDEKWYESPFGRGRPGWHTECVAMIKKYLSSGQDYEIDIHAGGIDLLFPHHENEAAQCRCSERKTLAKYWMHNGFIKVNDEKMSKSLGNSFFVKDALKQNLGEVLRFYLLSSHYRAHFNYSDDDLSASKKRLDKIYRLKKRVIDSNLGKENKEFKEEFLNAMRDDLNTSKALATIDEFVKTANENLDQNPKDKSQKGEILANLELIARVLGILQIDVYEYFQFGVSDEEKTKIKSLIEERNEAKKLKNYAKADEIREKLALMQIAIMDTPNGTMWEKI